jgi:OOP family OmpA-OmpF porin
LIDNDGDGKVDYPADPGCTHAGDNNEIDPITVTGSTMVARAGNSAGSSRALDPLVVEILRT